LGILPYPALIDVHTESYAVIDRHAFPECHGLVRRSPGEESCSSVDAPHQGGARASAMLAGNGGSSGRLT
jgi:hypothetical protein